MFWLDSCEPAILCRLGFKWDVWYVCDEMQKKKMKKMKKNSMNVMKNTMNAFREFGCKKFVQGKSEGKNDCWSYLCNVTPDVMHIMTLH